MISYYFDGILEEIKETLAERSQVKIIDMARRFNLGGELITDLIQQRLGSSLQGVLDGDTLYTDAYVAREKARIRGALSAVTKYCTFVDSIAYHCRPTSLNTVITTYEFKENLLIGKSFVITISGSTAKSSYFQKTSHRITILLF
jgi:hypothetical protein